MAFRSQADATALTSGMPRISPTAASQPFEDLGDLPTFQIGFYGKETPAAVVAG